MQVVQKKLKEHRQKANLTQREVAEELHISLQAYKHYEAGRRIPSLEMATKIADIFKITVDELVGR